MRSALVLFLFQFVCLAQHPLLTGAGIDWTTATAPITAASFMPNLAEYWEFTSPSLTTNAAVTNWIGALHGTVFTNGATSLQPTNSASGVGFAGTQLLTNLVPFSLGSNYTISVFYQYTANNLANFPGTLIGSNNATANHKNFVLELAFGGGSLLSYTMCNKAGTAISAGPNIPILSAIQDVVFCMSNNLAVGSPESYWWTNGALHTAPLSSGETLPEAFGAIGSIDGAANGAGQFKGWIQGIYIQTNFQGTTVNASNIHYYRTNFLTKGASP